MEDVWEQAAKFLEDTFARTGLELRVAVKHRSTGSVLDIEGLDSELLQSQTGELLEAVQHLINQIFGRQLPRVNDWFVTSKGLERRAKLNCKRWQILPQSALETAAFHLRSNQ